MWYHELEDEVVPAAYQAACKVCDHVHHVELRLENGGINVIVERRPTEAEHISVEAAVREALACKVADSERLKILVRRDFRLMYTSHLRQVSQAPKHLASLQTATRFTISLPEIIGLRNTYDKLVQLAVGHDFVATTALGGIPGLLHLIETIDRNKKPEDHSELGLFYDHLRARHHLFPGLLWSGTDREADLLYEWITTLPAGSTLLLFDTGSVGNGARRFLKVITERCGEGSSLGVGCITILGVVDAQDTAQKPEDLYLTHANGQTRVILDYHHVPRMLSEDCLELLGFESIRPEMMYRSANASAVIEIVSDSGEHIQSFAAMSGASALRHLIREYSLPETGNQEEAEDRVRFIGGLILCNGVRKELSMLQNAVRFGLINKDRAEKEAEAADKRAKATFEKDLIPHWDFQAKKKTRPNKRKGGE